MTFLLNINNAILNFFDKVFCFFDKVSKKKLFWPIMAVIVFILTTAFWFLFSFLNPTNGPMIYDKAGLNNPASISYSDGDIILSNYRVFLNGFTYNTLAIINVILIVVVLLVYIYLIINKRINGTRTVVFLCIIGYIIRLWYMGYVDCVTVNQHDVFSTNQYGHIQISFHIFYTGKPSPLVTYYPGTSSPLPNIEQCFDRSYQLYHTKFSYYFYAGMMKIISLFVGENQFLLAQSCKIVSTFMSTFMMVITVLIFKELKLSKRALLVATIVFLCMPTFIILGGNANNDTSLYFFIWLAILFAIKYFNKQKLMDVIILALSIGLAMGSKISGALIALPIGTMLIYMVIKYIKNHEFKKMLTHAGVFALIVIPVGLFWSFYNLKVYGYPFTYMWSVTNSGLRIDPNKTFFDRFINFNLIDLFNTPYLHLSGQYQDYNSIIFLIKSQLFGEWYLGKMWMPVCYAALTISVIFIFLMATALIYLLIKKISTKDINWLTFYGGLTFIFYGVIFLFDNKQALLSIILLAIGLSLFVINLIREKQIRNKKFFFFYLLFAVFIGNYISFNIKEPYVCTQDIRYVVPMLLCVTLCFGHLFDKIIPSKKKDNKIISN